jgi:hypothetical protein
MKMKKMKTEDILKELEELEDYEIDDFIHSLDLTKEQFEILSENEDMWVRWVIAEQPDLSKKLVYKLAEDEDYHIRNAIAVRPDLPKDLMPKLAEDENADVRWQIAERSELSEDLMYKLADDEDKYIRREIALKRELPDDLKYKLAEDEEWVVRLKIGLKRDLPKDLLISISCDYRLFVSRDLFKKLNNLKPEDVKNAYDLIRTSKYISRKKFKKTFDYIISKFPAVSEGAKLFKSLILNGKKDLK